MTAERGRLAHRVVNAVWKYSGMRAWHRHVQRLLTKDTSKEQQ